MKTILFDVETSGLEPGSRVVEIYSALLDDAGMIVDSFHALVHPEMPVPPDVTAIHGIEDCQLMHCQNAGTVLASWLDWLKGHAVEVGIAHNSPYDVGILSWELGRAGLPMPDIQVIDTCEMAKAIKATKKNSLVALVEHYGIVRQGQAHRAECDVLALREYWAIAKTKTQPIARPWASEYKYPGGLPKALEGFPKAVQDGAPFSFGYTDAQGNRTDRTITGYGWAENAAGVSFHGLCHLRKERRTFLAERITA